MAEVMTYTSLLADLRTYLERGSSVDTQVYAQLPRLVNLAERAICRKLKIQGFITSVTSNLDAGVSVYAKPDRWRRTISIMHSTPRVQIFARDLEYCRAYWPDPALMDVPAFYADYDYQHWLVVPTPVATVPFEVVYYQQPPYLETVNQTNWLTDYAPNALLYRALLEATPYLKNDERIPTWQNYYQEAMNDLESEDLKKIVDRNTTRQEA